MAPNTPINQKLNVETRTTSCKKTEHASDPIERPPLLSVNHQLEESSSQSKSLPIPYNIFSLHTPSNC